MRVSGEWATSINKLLLGPGNWRMTTHCFFADLTTVSEALSLGSDNVRFAVDRRARRVLGQHEAGAVEIAVQ